jgi:hypothetical protein
MGTGGGSDRAWLKPFEPRKPRSWDEEDVIGTHRMGSEALNVRNPQPGYRYTYIRRDPSSVQRFMNQGWRVVKADDPEQWGAELPDDVQKELDGVRAFKDVMLVKIDDEGYRVIQEDKQRRAQVATSAATQEYLDKGQRVEAELGSKRPEDDLYFKRGHHSES